MAVARIGVDYQMQLGNPSQATSDPSNHTNYLIQRAQYAMDYNDTTRQANWVSWSYTSSDSGSSGRQDSYRADTNLPTGFTRIGSATFGGGLDRGHMCPSADRTATVADNDATFFMSNMIPQTSQNNQGLWATFETYCRSLASGGSEVLIICGPGDFGTTTISNGMKLPGSVWKVVVVAPAGTATAPSKVNTACRVIAIHTPNTTTVGSSWTSYLTTVEQIEANTGFRFFSSLPTSVARYLRKVKDTGSGPNTPTVISAVSPISGTAGSTVTISGYNFGTTPVVKFNGVTASASVTGGGTQITATVPTSATTGTISVTSSSNGSDTSAETFTVTSPPSLTLSKTSLGGFSTTAGTASVSQSYTMTGTGLTANVVVTAPAGYEVSVDNVAFAGTLTLVPVNGNLTAVIYVRLSTAAQVGTRTLAITDTGGGANGQSVAVSGTVSAAPFDSWCTGYGLSGADAASTADPDGDGFVNLAEYALGGNPTNPTGGGWPTVSTTNTNGTNWLRFAYRARTNDSTLVIQPVLKVHLTETNWSTNGLVQKVSGQPAGDGVHEDQVWQTPLGADARRFLRLNISR